MVILVCENKDDEVRACLAALSAAGVSLEITSDVYTAMAQLAQGVSAETVIVDVRQLDGQEMRFLDRVPRFFPSCKVVAPLFAGTHERVSAYGTRRVEPLPVEDIVALLMPRHPTAPPGSHDERLTQQPPLDPDPDVHLDGLDDPDSLSTDGGPQDADAGPALYEAVRERMGAGESQPVCRSPPSRQ